jgi:hypothetical protein
MEAPYDFSGGEMNNSLVFYLCPICFYASEIPDDRHEHVLLRVDPGLPGDDRRKPVTDQKGHIRSAAPRWFYEATLQAKLVPYNTQ